MYLIFVEILEEKSDISWNGENLVKNWLSVQL